MKLTWTGERPWHCELDVALVQAAITSRWMLVPVLVAGLFFRLLDIGRPFVGLHMWNEVYYVQIARNFDHFGFLSAYNYNAMGGSPLAPMYGPPPLVSWLVYISSKFLGTAEWVARLPILMLGMFCLVALNFIALELYNSRVAIIAVFLASVMPGLIFFSRQIALDTPMTAFGLGAVWTMLIANRTGRYRWAFASSVFLALAIFTKYTAVLFLPSLIWIWMRTIWRDERKREKSRWLMTASYLLIAALPAVAWFAITLKISSSEGATAAWSGYLNRVSEWDLGAFKLALEAAWTRTSEQVGYILWYPLIIIVPFAFATGRMWSFLKRHIEVVLLIIPWYIQVIYPTSWVFNDGYDIPALYGLALLSGVVSRDLMDQAVRLPDFFGRHSRYVLSLLGIFTLITLSCLWDYRTVYRSWYSSLYSTEFSLQSQANLITQGDPFSAARLIRSINVSHKPILADTPATLYYAQEEYWRGFAVWNWWGLGGSEKLVAAIQSGEFEYIVFAYQPPAEVADAIITSGYHLISPGAWARSAPP